MSIGVQELARAIAKTSKSTDNPLTIKDATFLVKSLFQLISTELEQPDGRVELENFMVFQNRPYIRTGINTRRIALELSPKLKKRLKARTAK